MAAISNIDHFTRIWDYHLTGTLANFVGTSRAPFSPRPEVGSLCILRPAWLACHVFLIVCFEGSYIVGSTQDVG